MGVMATRAVYRDCRQTDRRTDIIIAKAPRGEGELNGIATMI